MLINRACDVTNEKMEWDGVGPDLSHEEFHTSIIETTTSTTEERDMLSVVKLGDAMLVDVIETQNHLIGFDQIDLNYKVFESFQIPALIEDNNSVYYKLVAAFDTLEETLRATS